MGAFTQTTNKNVCKIKNCEKKTKSLGLCDMHYKRKCRGEDLNAPVRNARHGFYNSPEYRSWQAMKQRCLNPNHPYFKYYGGKGIKICSSWMNFINFFNDMGRRPSLKFTLDRKDSDKGYYLENCQWSDKNTQSRGRKYCRLDMNRANEIKLLYSTGRFSLEELAECYEVSYITISDVIRGKTWKE